MKILVCMYQLVVTFYLWIRKSYESNIVKIKG